MHKKNLKEIDAAQGINSTSASLEKLAKAQYMYNNRIELVKRILRELVSSNRANAKMELAKALEQQINSVLTPHKGI